MSASGILLGYIRVAARDAAGSNLVRDAAATLANRVALLGIGLISSVLVARALGPDGRGTLAVAVAVTAVCIQFGNLGLHASNTWAIAREPHLIGTLVANSLVVGLGVGLAIGGALLVASAVQPGLVPIPSGLLWLAAISVPAGLVYLLLQNLLLGADRISAYNFLELATKGIAAVLIVALIATGRISVEAAFGVSAAAMGAGAVGAFLLLGSRGGSIRPKASLLKDHARYGFRAYLAALMSFLVLRVDLIILDAIRGSADAGYYSVAVTLADLVYLLPVVVGTLLFPKLAAIPGTNERRRVTRRAFFSLVPTMIGLAVIAVMVAQPGVDLVYGSEYSPAVPAFVWLMPGIIMLALYTTLASYFAAGGMPLIAIGAPATGLLLNVLLNFALIPGFGAVGASIASSVSYGLMLLIGAAKFALDKEEDA